MWGLPRSTAAAQTLTLARRHLLFQQSSPEAVLRLSHPPAPQQAGGRGLSRPRQRKGPVWAFLHPPPARVRQLWRVTLLLCASRPAAGEAHPAARCACVWRHGHAGAGGTCLPWTAALSPRLAGRRGSVEMTKDQFEKAGKEDKMARTKEAVKDAKSHPVLRQKTKRWVGIRRD